ncbi:type 1 fimbrial protein [Dyella sp. ASV21]|uniref:fimbrial protein n=1 Tax=Dyella sp. ASV21 TaxID=2795114 RepID=UPI0018EB8528|nr:type 1 fimbrial protein [Dyella sp. ASV21]
MKKILLSAATASVLGIAALASSSAYAYDGQITVTGSVTAVTCTITLGGGATGSASDIKVDLVAVSQAALKSGQRAGDKAFSMTVGGTGQTGCTNGGTASLSMDTTNVNASGRIKNSGTATGVEIEFADAGGTALDLTKQGPKVVIAGNTAVLNYVARYYATANAGAGSVLGTVNYSIAYN